MLREESGLVSVIVVRARPEQDVFVWLGAAQDSGREF